MGNDTIYRQDAIDAINTWDKFGIDERSRVVRWHEGLEPYVKLRDVVWAIENLPSVQPDIIRCKDCKYCEETNHVFYWCDGRKVWEDHYCGYAERRTDGN